MTRRTSWTCLIAIALGVVVAGAGPGTSTPDLKLTTEAGTTVRLADLKGSVVLVDFWASWCIPCRTSFPAIDALQKELRDRGLAVVAVSVDEHRRDADLFLGQRSHTMTVAFDPRGVAAEAFDLKGMPSTVLIERHGVIRYTHMGYTEKTIQQFRTEIRTLLSEAE